MKACKPLHNQPAGAQPKAANIDTSEADSNIDTSEADSNIDTSDADTNIDTSTGTYLNHS